MIKVSEPSVEGRRHLVPLFHRHHPRQGEQAKLRRGGKFSQEPFSHFFLNSTPLLTKGQLHLAGPVTAPQIGSTEEEAEQKEVRIREEGEPEGGSCGQLGEEGLLEGSPRTTQRRSSHYSKSKDGTQGDKR